MKISVTTKHLKMSPKKMRQVVAVIRNMDVTDAIDQLNFIPRKASLLILKTLKSGIANAQHNFNLKKENLFIKEIFVNQGPVLKRFTSKAFGRVGDIHKRSSDLTIFLDERVASKNIKPITQKLDKIVPESQAKEEDKPMDRISDEISDSKPNKEFSKPKEQKIFDAHRKGKYKPGGNKDKSKNTGGTLKRLFNRKSI
ncbi:MAG: 50S ribosomal protein L22 [Patescibacteria group bacterium]|nr:50S ribosomal protein L22 [Patescibacteria group bacterium]MDD5164667.1 50S ribosomal protein L22 [Patescibacteria group bacterium]MDD5534807.1 50S ribosomal protein L22 [Patescibacteria group bacterium]